MSLTLTLERGGGEVSGSGTDITLGGTGENYVLESVEMYGNTKQNIVEGAQLLTKQGMGTIYTDSNFWYQVGTNRITVTPMPNGWARIEQISGSNFGNFNTSAASIKGFAPSTTYTIIVELHTTASIGSDPANLDFIQTNQAADSFGSFTVVTGASASDSVNARVNLASPDAVSVIKATTKSSLANCGLRFYTRNNVPAGAKFDIRATVLLGDHSTDWEDYIGDKWQPFVGGEKSPNPNYFQEVQSVTGEQRITLCKKNLFDNTNYNMFVGYFDTNNRYLRTIYGNSNNCVFWIPCEPNTAYSFRLPTAGANPPIGAKVIGTTSSYPLANTPVHNISPTISRSTDKYENYVTDADARYLVVRVQGTSFLTGGGGLEETLRVLQIEKGATITPYEEYEGQTYEVNLGKNLLKNSGVTTEINGVTFTVNDDKSVTVQGTATAAAWFKLTESITLDADCFMSGCPVGGSSSTFSLQTSFDSAVSADYGSGVQLHSGKTDPVWIVVRSGQGFLTPTTFYPQIEKGYKATSYAQFIESFGANLYDKNTAPLLAGYFNSTGKLASVTESLDVGTNRWTYISCEPNTTYTITKPLQTTTSKNRFRIGTMETLTIADGIPLDDFWYMPDGGTYTSHTITTGANAHYLLVYFGNATATGNPGGEIQDVMDGLKIEQGAITHSGQLELCKIGDYQDHIYKSGDDWYIHKETGEIVLTGSEDWSPGTTRDGIAYYYSKTGDSVISTSALQGYSTGFRVLNSVITSNNPATRESGLCSLGTDQSTNKIRCLVDSTLAHSAADWTALLAANNVTMYFVLAQSTDIKITNTALISQLESLLTAETYEGRTNIFTSSPNLLNYLEVTAESPVRKTYTEVEIGSPFTISDVEGKSSNTTLDGNVYVDWAYNKKQYSFDLFNLTPQDYADIRAFYDYQFNNSAFPTITVPELNIDKLPVYMEISSRNIINQCLLTDKLTIKFRETVQP